MQRKRREIPVCGWKAVSAVFARHPESVLRLFFDARTGREAGEWCKYLARERRIYRQVTPAELEKVAGTVHHGGIVAITARAELPELTRGEVEAWAHARQPLVVLDRISNHHNLGALARTAAYFGVPALVHGRAPGQALATEATYRIAEGGMEHIQLREVASLPDFLREIRPLYLVLGAALQGEPLENVRLARTGPRARPVALVLGNEEHGLAPEVLAACEQNVLIAGSGHVESLNVAAAGAILMHWFFGRR